MLPGMDGLEVCKRIQRDAWTPVLMLTAKTEEADKVAGFAVGADDYLTKPFSLRELAVRVQAILRRRERIETSPDGEPIEHDGLVIDAKRRRVEVDGSEIPLTPLEFEILLTLAREPGVVLSRDQLMDRIWGYRDHAGGRVVDSHVARSAAQDRRGRQRPALHPHRPRCRVRVQGVTMATRPFDRLTSIRAKLGSTVVIAVGLALLISYLLIAFALRNSPRDSEAIDALSLARKAATGQPRMSCRPTRWS